MLALPCTQTPGLLARRQGCRAPCHTHVPATPFVVGHKSRFRHLTCQASSTEDAKAALRELKLARNGITIDPAYASGATFLKTVIGLSNPAEISRILDIAMNPNSLFIDNNLRGARGRNASARSLDADKDMMPVVEFFLSKGLSKGDVAKIVSGHPPVLSYDVSTRLEPFWDFLASLGTPDVGAALAGRPTVLGLDVDKLKKITGYLQSIETPPEEIIRLVSQSI